MRVSLGRFNSENGSYGRMKELPVSRELDDMAQLLGTCALSSSNLYTFRLLPLPLWELTPSPLYLSILFHVTLL
jgi:hypothetical protein